MLAVYTVYMRLKPPYANIHCGRAHVFIFYFHFSSRFCPLSFDFLARSANKGVVFTIVFSTVSEFL